MPVFPLTVLDQVSDTSFPNDVTNPKPVIATLFILLALTILAFLPATVPVSARAKV